MALFNKDLTDAAAQARSAVITPTVRLAAGLGGDDILALSSALNAEVHPVGMVRPFLAHQGAAYLYAQSAIERWGCALIGDTMGLGKTQVLLALAADAVRTTGRPAIIVAPPVTKGGYISDLQAAYPSLRFHHVAGRTGSPADLPAADIYWMTDDSLTLKHWLTFTDDRGKLQTSPFAAQASILVRDEIHRDKGAQGKPSTRAKVMLAVSATLRAAGAPIIGATGTILTNRPIEALIPLQILGGLALVKAITPGARNVMGFAFHYCNPVHNGYGYNYNGTDLTRMAQLHEYLRRTVYVRREREALGDTLPHGGWCVAPFALNGVMARYNRIEREFLDLVREEEGPEAMMRKARAETLTRMGALREEAGKAKVAAAIEYAMDLVNQGEQVILFYEHTSVWEGLAKALSPMKIGAGPKAPYVQVGTINGSVTGDRRTQAVADFQAGKTNVLLAQTRAAGIGVTLTAAAHACFVQLPWSAGDLAQAAGRILRADDISRDRALAGGTVTWHVLNACKADGTPTMDGYLWQVLETKAQVCDAVNAGKPITMPDGSVMDLALSAWFAGNS